ncbi:helix-turn-helix domain-containing protein [Actinomadura fulvescens]|uniref:Helix-turn-helix domain-containing protein n=1 Tax=Actinomadura fulvescens TaxID=46160 RepID=A0ABP6DBG9_9ACTN
MRLIRFSTERVPPRDRFECWQNRGDSAMMPTRLSCDDPGDFLGRARAVILTDVRVAVMTHPSVRISRPAKLVRRSDPEVYQVNLVLSGEAGLAQAGRDTVCGAGRFTIFDSSRPFEAWRTCAGDVTSGLTVQLPRRMLPLPADTADQLTAISFPAERGVSAVFAHWLTDLVHRAEELSEQDAPVLADITADLLGAALTQHLDRPAPQTAESRRRVLRLQIEHFVRQRLGDPGLSPASIADAHHISVRHLHELFAQQEMTVAAWIRHLRLEQCRGDLADPRFRSRPITAIAARWSFTDAAHFNRAFRAAYGMPPGHYRRHVLDER